MKLPAFVKHLLPQKTHSSSQCAFLASDLEVRFSHPAENLKLNREDADIFFVPITYFINTKTQQRFEEWGDLYSFFLAYRTGWRLHKTLGAQALFVTIKMSVTVYHQQQNARKAHGALNAFEHIETWLVSSYKKRHAVFGQLGLTPCDNGFSHVEFRDISDTEREAEALAFSFDHREVNGRMVTSLNPYFNVYDYYFVLDDSNALCFSFELEYGDSDHINDLMSLVKPDIQSVLKSVTISLREQDGPQKPELPQPTKKLSGGGS